MAPPPHRRRPAPTTGSWSWRLTVQVGGTAPMFISVLSAHYACVWLPGMRAFTPPHAHPAGSPPPHSLPAAVVGMSWGLMCLFIVSFFLSSASASAAARERAALEEKLAGPAPGSKHPHHAEVRRPGGQAAGSAADTDPWMARSLLSRQQEQPPSPVFFSSPLSLCGRGSGWPWAGWRIACCCILQRPVLDTESSAAALPSSPAGDPVGNQAGSRQALQPAAGLAAVLPLQVVCALVC